MHSFSKKPTDLWERLSYRLTCPVPVVRPALLPTTRALLTMRTWRRTLLLKVDKVIRQPTVKAPLIISQCNIYCGILRRSWCQVNATDQRLSNFLPHGTEDPCLPVCLSVWLCSTN